MRIINANFLQVKLFLLQNFFRDGFDCKLYALNYTLAIRLYQIGRSLLQTNSRLLRPVAMLAQTLQISNVVNLRVLLRNNMINVNLRLANFLPALRASVPPMIRFIFRKPVFPVAHFPSISFHEIFIEGWGLSPSPAPLLFVINLSLGKRGASSTTPNQPPAHPEGWFDATC